MDHKEESRSLRNSTSSTSGRRLVDEAGGWSVQETGYPIGRQVMRVAGSEVLASTSMSQARASRLPTTQFEEERSSIKVLKNLTSPTHLMHTCDLRWILLTAFGDAEGMAD